MPARVAPIGRPVVAIAARVPGTKVTDRVDASQRKPGRVAGNAVAAATRCAGPFGSESQYRSVLTRTAIVLPECATIVAGP